MKAIKSFFTSTVGIALSFVLAAGLLLFGSVGGARAALTYYSENYQSQVKMKDIGVSLIENGVNISRRDYFYEVADGTWNEYKGVLLGTFLKENDKLKLGKPYNEALNIENTGNIDTYVRVSVYKYWVDSKGNKTNKIHPDLIELNFTPGNDWIIDDAATTAERTVLYYKHVLPAGTLANTPFTDTLTISPNIDTNVKQVITPLKGGGFSIEKFYDYNGYKFVLEANVDAVQTHNAEAAIRSAWGREVTISNNTLSLK